MSLSLKTRKIIRVTIRYIFLSAVLFITVFPILYLFCASFKTNSEILLSPDKIFPEKWTLDNYTDAFQSENFNMGLMLWNSIWYTGLNVLIGILVAITSGYAFERGEFPLKKTIFAVFTSLMFIKISGITVYPMFDILGALGMTTGLGALLFQHIFAIDVVGMHLVRGFVRQIPRDLDEAATIDGCTVYGTFFRVICPLLLPIIATLVISKFTGSWNTYVMPHIFTCNRPEQRTLVVGIMSLKNSGEGAASNNLMLAGTALSLIPVLIVYAACNRYFVQGLTAGAVKG